MTWKNQETVGPGNQLKKVFQERGSDPMGHNSNLAVAWSLATVAKVVLVE